MSLWKGSMSFLLKTNTGVEFLALLHLHKPAWLTLYYRHYTRWTLFLYLWTWYEWWGVVLLIWHFKQKLLTQKNLFSRRYSTRKLSGVVFSSTCWDSRRSVPLLNNSLSADTNTGHFPNRVAPFLTLPPSASFILPAASPVSPYQWGSRRPRPAQSTASRFILCSKSATAGEPGNACKLCVCNLVTSQA